MTATLADSADKQPPNTADPDTLRVLSLASESFDFPPYAWIDSRSGKEHGLGINVLKRFARELQRPLELIDGNYSDPEKFADGMQSLKSGKLQLLNAMYKTSSAPPFLHYPKQALYQLDIKIYTLADKAFSYSGWSSLLGKRGAAIQQFSLSVIDDEAFNDFAQQNLAIRGEKSIHRLFELLLAGEVDYLITPGSVTEALLHFHQLRDEIVALEKPLASLPVYLVFANAENNAALIRHFNRRLIEMRASGQLQHMERNEMSNYLKYRQSVLEADVPSPILRQ